VMIYFAKISKQKDRSYLVEFPDLPGCYTEGDTLLEAKKNAKEALDGWLAAHCDLDLKTPKSKTRMSKNFYPIKVDLQLEFPILLRKIRKKKGFTQAEIAKKMGISQQAFAKLEDPKKANPSLLTIQKLSEVLDTEIDFKIAV